MKKLLVCGFEPFGGESINPSWEAVERLADEICGFEIHKLRLPVVFGEAADLAIESAERLGVDAVLCIGQAGGRGAITPELVGINLRYAKIPDNKGNKPCDEPITEGGAAARFSTLPMRKMSENIMAAGIPSELSYSAGTYVCNDLLYTLLSHFEGGAGVGFIHIPYSKEQGKSPSMDMDDIVKGLTVAIKSID